MTTKPKVIEFYGETPEEESGYCGQLDLSDTEQNRVILFLQDKFGDSMFENFQLGEDLNSALENIEDIIARIEKVKDELEKAIALNEKKNKKRK